MQLRAAAVAPFISPRTVAIYASAPTFSHGVVDPIQEVRLAPVRCMRAAVCVDGVATHTVVSSRACASKPRMVGEHARPCPRRLGVPRR